MDKETIERLQREWVEGLNPNSERLTIIATNEKTMIRSLAINLVNLNNFSNIKTSS